MTWSSSVFDLSSSLYWLESKNRFCKTIAAPFLTGFR
ncbi:MAG: hypothetical protein EOO68_19825 [Moraxellaceae bacterium]|nr:MAG: hypothetical protein EOO68_19825 [Moraxellaceae bacterium]